MVKNLQTDNNFIRVPGQVDTTLPKGEDKTLFPLATGNHWDFNLKIGDREQRRTDMATGQIVVQGPVKIENADGYLLLTKVDGVVTKAEAFSVNKGGVALMAVGVPNNLSTMSPPIPFLKFPVVEGSPNAWTGILHYGKSSGFGTALSRVSGHAKVKTDEGVYNAYRVDMLIETTVNGMRETIPVTRWLAPGIGIVNQRELTGKNVEVWTLQSHQVGRN